MPLPMQNAGLRAPAALRRAAGSASITSGARLPGLRVTVRRRAPLSAAKRVSAASEQSYTLPDGTLKVSVTRVDSRLDLQVRPQFAGNCPRHVVELCAQVTSSLTRPMVLHWGVVTGAGQPWSLPPAEMVPPGSSLYAAPAGASSAAQTPFVALPGGGAHVRLSIAAASAPPAVAFVLRDAARHGWVDHTGDDFRVDLTAAVSESATPPVMAAVAASGLSAAARAATDPTNPFRAFGGVPPPGVGESEAESRARLARELQARIGTLQQQLAAVSGLEGGGGTVAPSPPLPLPSSLPSLAPASAAPFFTPPPLAPAPAVVPPPAVNRAAALDAASAAAQSSSALSSSLLATSGMAMAGFSPPRLLVIVAEAAGGGRLVTIASDALEPLAVHWGTLRSRNDAWRAPNREISELPTGTASASDKAARTPLVARGDGTQAVSITLTPEEASRTACLAFVAVAPLRDAWFKTTQGGDFVIDLRTPAGAQQATVAVAASVSPAASRAGDTPPGAVELVGLSKWVGDDIKLSGTRGDGGSRRGRWDTTGLEGAAKAIVEGDKGASSFRQKLDMVKGVLLGRGADGMNVDALAYAAIYLYWVQTGAIACTEDGQHYRPNHHANTAKAIFEALEATAAAAAGGPAALPTAIVVRRLHPRLPAFTAEFTQQVPLTRIRDIAHGKGDDNGRCRDIRTEIKHTIQNKLHRCAGPEDLIATEKMLAKLTAPGTDYPAAFVSEFKLFYKELKEFFNASSVTDRLDVLLAAPGALGPLAMAHRDFVAAKAGADAVVAGSPGERAAVAGALRALTLLRGHVASHVAAARGGDSAAAQQWRLAEIGLEDYAFVLLSRLLNALGAGDEAAGSGASSAKSMDWELAGDALEAALANLALGGLEPDECAAVAKEASALAAGRLGGVPDWPLRVAAAAERARRLADRVCESIASLYGGRASSLGAALGIPTDSVKVYVESEIRASLVFQLAKLCTLLLRAARAATGAVGWDTLVAGTASGTLVAVHSLGAVTLPPGPGPFVLLAEHATGDEEVGASLPGVLGVVLCQSLPHLSHLAIRARQERIVFVTCEDESLAVTCRALTGRVVTLDARGAGGVKLTLAATGAGRPVVVSPTPVVPHPPHAPPQLMALDVSHAGTAVPLVALAALPGGGTTVGGAKSSACAALAALAVEASALGASGAPALCGFAAPGGAVVPFGSMEAAAVAAGRGPDLAALLRDLESAGESDVDAACAHTRALVASLRPPAAALAAAAAAIPSGRAMVRSSANVEDLAGMSAAGLYDSLPNIPSGDPLALGAAIAAVWASLYTRRAVLARRAAGVPQAAASMAVLIQEMATPDVSFVLHTVNPVSSDADELYAELAPGLGETLASGGVPGSPWRIVVSKTTGVVRVLAFASFSSAMVADPGAAGGVKLVTADYSTHWLTTDAVARTALGQQLAAVGRLLEMRLGGPQDVEGGVQRDRSVFIVQARPQP